MIEIYCNEDDQRVPRLPRVIEQSNASHDLWKGLPSGPKCLHGQSGWIIGGSEMFLPKDRFTTFETPEIPCNDFISIPCTVFQMDFTIFPHGLCLGSKIPRRKDDATSRKRTRGLINFGQAQYSVVIDILGRKIAGETSKQGERYQTCDFCDFDLKRCLPVLIICYQLRVGEVYAIYDHMSPYVINIDNCHHVFICNISNQHKPQ